MLGGFQGSRQTVRMKSRKCPGSSGRQPKSSQKSTAIQHVSPFSGGKSEMKSAPRRFYQSRDSFERSVSQAPHGRAGWIGPGRDGAVLPVRPPQARRQSSRLRLPAKRLNSRPGLKAHSRAQSWRGLTGKDARVPTLRTPPSENRPSGRRLLRRFPA